MINYRGRIDAAKLAIGQREKIRDCALKIHELLLEFEALNFLDYGDGETFTIMNLALRVKRGYQT